MRAVFGAQKGLPHSMPVPGYVYVKHMRESRTRIVSGFAESMKGLDALIMPTTVMPAAKIGEDDQVDLEGRMLPTMTTFTRNANPFNIVRFPAITVPAGHSRTGLPIGLQIVTKPWGDAALLGIAHEFEQATKHRRPPKLS